MAQDRSERLALDELLGRYARLIRSVVLRVAGDRAALVGDDVEQQVLVALWKVVQGEQTIRHPASYIYRTAVRETVRVLRQEHRRGETADGMVERIDGRVRTPEELAGARELGAQIKEALEELPGDRRRAVRAHLAGFSVREIMEMFDWPYNRARNLIARGMADLRRELRTRGIDGRA
ncbi:MAG TPA: sigma-70 family RNA polymerase sigma factor [Acidobacteria bacterium]|nr:sigma-70 family RNA polymerase sigma factor [Acidobacteriota bacterium]